MTITLGNIWGGEADCCYFKVNSKVISYPISGIRLHMMLINRENRWQVKIVVH